MLEMTKLSDEDVWKIVKDIRKKFLYEHDDPKCEEDGPFLFNNEKVDYNTYHIKDLTNELADKLKLNTTYETNENISYKILQTGAEMFLYLNYCPYKLDKSYGLGLGFLFTNNNKYTGKLLYDDLLDEYRQAEKLKSREIKEG